MNETVPNVEIDAILEKIGDAKISHVPDEERRWAVERAVRIMGIHSRMEVAQLIEIISTHEGQLSVHAEPGDPKD